MEPVKWTPAQVANLIDDLARKYPSDAVITIGTGGEAQPVTCRLAGLLVLVRAWEEGETAIEDFDCPDCERRQLRTQDAAHVSHLALDRHLDTDVVYAGLEGSPSLVMKPTGSPLTVGDLRMAAPELVTG